MQYLYFLLLSICVNGIVIQDARRTIDLKSHLTKVNYDFTISGQVKDFIFTIENAYSDNLAVISAKQKTKTLDYKEIERNDKGDRQFVFTGFDSENSVVLKVKCVFFGLQTPKPAEISQKEEQHVKYYGNSIIYSSYPIEKQTSEVLLPQTSILNYQFDDKKFTKASGKFNLGPYSSQKPFTASSFSVHFATASDFLTITNLDRSIELSHWGNVAVEDSIDIYHSGALLKGEFSKFEFRYGHGLQSSIRNWVTYLPNNAKDIYYRDAIGNISTSHVSKANKAVKLEIEPRFPLMGGWKTQYTIGYNLPTLNYLFNSGEEFAFRFKFIDHVHKDQFVEKMNLEVILPECVEDVRIELPYSAQRLPDTLRPTYLDTQGRKVIRLIKTNLVEDHIQEMIVYYRFSMIKMLREFAFSIIAVFVIFLSIIVYVRLDFSIQKNHMKEAQQKIQSIVGKIIDLQEGQFKVYERMENALKVYRFEKDQEYLTSEWKKTGKTHSENNAKLSAIKSKIAVIWPEGNEKLSTLQAKDKSMMALLQESHQLTEKLVSNKINKTQFQTSDNELSDQKTALFSGMESILDKI